MIPKILGFLPDSLVAAHPSISTDGLTLYFVSDMAGGFGKKDIWKVTRDKTGRCLVKTGKSRSGYQYTGDELFPYIREDGTLYFSSDGHIGMGGLDIFKAKPQPDGSWVVQNMKPPINSYADDFGIAFRG